MATKIRLKRLGKIRTPHYRVVVMDSRTKRDGRPIEEIGQYHPKNDPSIIDINSERAQYWLGVGAQPTEAVVALLKRTGDWQKFSGDTSPSGVIEQKPRPDKVAIFNAALAEADGEPTVSATTVSKRARKVSEASDAIADALAGKPAEDAEDAVAVVEAKVEAPVEAAEAKVEEAVEAPVEEAVEVPVVEAAVPAEAAEAEAEAEAPAAVEAVEAAVEETPAEA